MYPLLKRGNHECRSCYHLKRPMANLRLSVTMCSLRGLAETAKTQSELSAFLFVNRPQALAEQGVNVNSGVRNRKPFENFGDFCI